LKVQKDRDKNLLVLHETPGRERNDEANALNVMLKFAGQKRKQKEKCKAG